MPKKARGRPRKVPPSKGVGSRRSRTFARPETRASKGGRRSKWNDSFIALAHQMVAVEDATDAEMAKVIGIDRGTLSDWKRKVPEFARAFIKGEKKQGRAVEQAMFHKASGYSYPSEKVFQYQGKVVRAKLTEHVPPDAAAAKLFLQGNMPDKYGDKLELAGNADRPINFVIEGLELPPKEAKKEAGNVPQTDNSGSPAAG